MSERNRARLAGWGTLAAALALFSGCTEGTAPQVKSVDSPLFSVVSAEPELGKVKLCKIEGTGEFVVSINGVSSTVTVSDGECVVVHEWFSQVTINFVTIFETTQPESLVCEETGLAGACYFVDDNFVQVRVSGKKGATVTFTNPTDGGEPLLGRMTGGGFQLRMDGVRITRGFTIHCDVTLTNNLEINWRGGNKWHITKEDIVTDCVDDPNVQPDPPPAPFDTFNAVAGGVLNNEGGRSEVHFTFVDAGEPGSKEPCQLGTSPDDPQVCDWASIRIFDDSGTEVLFVEGFLDGGNIQAHFDQSHK